MSSYLALVLIYIFFMISIYTDFRKIKGMNEKITESIRCIVIGVGVATVFILMFSFVKGVQKEILETIGRNMIVIVLAVFSLFFHFFQKKC